MPPAVLFVAILTTSLIVVLVGAAAVTQATARERREAVKRAADALGLRYLEKGDKSFVEAWAQTPALKRHGKARDIVYGIYRGRPVTCFEHRYVVSTGSTTAVVEHSVFAADVLGVPEFALKRRRGVVRWWRTRFSPPAPSARSGGLDADWDLKAEANEYELRRVLEEVDTRLVHDPRRAQTWRVVQDKLCLLVARRMTAEDLRPALDRLVGVADAVEAWAEGGGGMMGSRRGRGAQFSGSER